MKKQKGFTLIEMMVVIVIIAILAAIVIVKVSDYNAKGKNSSIKGNLSTLATKSVEYFEKNNNYNSFCASDTGGGYIGAQIESPQVASTFTCNCDVAFCAAVSTKWCACAPLKPAADMPAGTVFCVDSTGLKKEAFATDCATECPASQARCQ